MPNWLSDLLSEVRYRFRAVFRKRSVEHDLDDEIRFHIEQEAKKLEAAGLTSHEARRQASIAFGGVERIKDDTRDVRGVSWLEVVLQDLRYAARGLRARPAFTASVILTLGLGIGANVAMFGIVDQLLIRPPAHLRDPSRVHRIYLTSVSDGRDVTDGFTEYARYLDFARYTKTLDATAVLASNQFAVGVGEDAKELPIGIVSASFWNFFDARPALGRYFTASEDSIPTGSPVAVLSYAFWQARYGGSPDVLGKSVQIGPALCTIVGVAPPGFVGIPDQGMPAAFIPATLYGFGVSSARGRIDYYNTYHWGWLSVLVRRKPNVSIEATNADLTNAYRLSWEAERAISPNLSPPEIARPRAVAGPVVLERGPNATPVARLALWIAGVAAIVLLIACANVANLLLARALFRRREIALRLAIGASQRRLFAQLLTESLLLGTLGGVSGILAAQWGGAILRSLFLSEVGTADVVRDVRTLAFAGAAALVAGLMTGLVPALQAGRAAVAPALKTGARGGTYHHSRTRTILLVLQGALSVLLLVGAGLFVRSLHNVRSMRLGYDVDPVLYVEINLRGLRLPLDQRADLARRLVEAARTIPEVASAARGISVPFWSTESLGFIVPGVDSLRRLGRFTVQMASADYFTTLGTRILKGRGFTDADRADGPLVAVVSQGMAEAVWPGIDAIGQCIKIDRPSDPCRLVVGVAENIHQNSLTENQKLQYYLPSDQMRPNEANVFVRTRGDASAHAETVRRVLQRVMPGASYVSVMPMRDIIDPRQRSWQIGATMFLVFGVLALVLAAIGLYSVVAYGVAQRTQEIGVRIALGAGVSDVVGLVVGQGLRFAVLGIVVGGATAWWASGWVGPLLFSVSPKDPVVYGTVAIVLLAAALLASAIPAARAARVDPNVALRTE
ncbi:MAG TPA: ABC transporter permease [Gemmatimonadaceae bacterium]|nr:ABC transporter permease [Gemmatimonadaceae bacterium]